ncbi:MAG: ribonuclease Z [Candidatus Nanoarchaeia archaeon]
MAEKIKLTFLGTGSAVPTKRKNHPSILLRYKDENILIDCGEGTQRQLRKARLNPCKITRILITHWHADHVLGLPGLIQTLMLNEYGKTLHIYGPKGTKKMMQLYLALFARKEKISIQIHEPTSKIDMSEFYIKTSKMKHDAPCLAYAFKIKDKKRINKEKLSKLNIQAGPELKKLKQGKSITINGKKISSKQITYKEKGKKITFILDTRENKQAINLAKDSDLLVCESTYSQEEEEIAKEYHHLTSTQAANIAKKSKSKQLILTHLSQRYDTKQQESKLLKQAQSIFKNTKIAEDLMSIEI